MFKKYILTFKKTKNIALIHFYRNNHITFDNHRKKNFEIQIRLIAHFENLKL